MTIRKITQKDVDLVNEITHTKVKGKSVNFDDVPEERIINRRHFGNLLTATHVDHVWKEEEVNDIWTGLRLAPPKDWKPSCYGMLDREMYSNCGYDSECKNCPYVKHQDGDKK